MNLLRKQNRLLSQCESPRSLMVSGPLSRLLIEGRIDMLKWYMTIREAKGPDRSLSLDGRVLQMLQKQKDLLSEPVNDRRPGQTSKMEIQGRIEILEWLLLDEQSNQEM